MSRHFLKTMAMALAGLALMSCDQVSQNAPSTFAQSVAGLDEQSGLFSIYADEDRGRVLAALPAPDQDGVSLRAIHIAYLRSGLGSNPVGLDRGLSSGPAVVRFEIHGPKVLLVAENTRFTAGSDNPAEQRAVAESFARSVLWSGDVEAASEDGRVLVDLSSYLTSDVLGVSQALADANQGAFAIAADRSGVAPRDVLVFPDNVELEAFLTFTASEPGSEVRATAANANAPTFTVHHSFVRLPDDNFVPRRFDPRMGMIGLPIADYAAGLDQSIERQWALRHRLIKTDPSAPSSPVEEPIVFYIDPGAPDPVRQALIEGASWWAQAFEAAGFDDAYRVEELPEGAHPLDARYNVVQWVHRQTRGWSYGQPIYDPRTGEIIKAVITLGSLRVRHDRTIFEGLTDASRTGTGGANDPVQISLARLRQLSAHEVGHGLGFPHNFAASVNDRASVMDYPAPKVSITPNGVLDLSDAYDEGIGEWDIAATRVLYTQFPDDADEAAELNAIIDETRAAGLLFMSDADARSAGAAHPAAALWDNGEDAIVELEHALNVRRIALAKMGVGNIPAGAQASELREILSPIYFWHRYAVDAAAKQVGGYSYAYAIADRDEANLTAVNAERQQAALDVLLRAASVQELSFPPGLIDQLAPPRSSWFDASSREVVQGHKGPIFDEQAAVAAAAGHVYQVLFAPERVSRLAAPLLDDQNAMPLDRYLSQISARALWDVETQTGRNQANAEAIAHEHLTALFGLYDAEDLSPVAHSKVERHLVTLSQQLSQAEGQFERSLARRIDRFFEKGEAEAPSPQPIPPGSPIGNALMIPESGWHD